LPNSFLHRIFSLFTEPGPNLHGVLHITFAKTLHNDCTILSGHIKGIVRQIDYKTQVRLDEERSDS